jgi:hypothetical protein
MTRIGADVSSQQLWRDELSAPSLDRLPGKRIIVIAGPETIDMFDDAKIDPRTT